MTTDEYLLSMARYHHWAGQRLIAALSTLSDDEYQQPAGLFFSSVHGTLNHLLLADCVWHGRLSGHPFAITGLDQEIHTQRTALASALLQQALVWQDYLAALTVGMLAQNIVYKSSTGQSFSLSREAILMHVFNHATHHRGQISAVISRYGQPCPEMDLVYQLLADDIDERPGRG